MACSNMLRALGDLNRVVMHLTKVNPVCQDPKFTYSVFTLTQWSLYFAIRKVDLTLINIPGRPACLSMGNVNNAVAKVCSGDSIFAVSKTILLIKLIQHWLSHLQGKSNIWHRLDITFNGNAVYYDLISTNNCKHEYVNKLYSMETLFDAIETDLANAAA